jgi:hypothetical protein
MSNIYELKNRLLIPNWRDFNRTTILGELGELNSPKLSGFDDSFIKLDWNNNKTIGVAADLISNLFISNDLYAPELAEAISFVENNSSDASSPLLALIYRIKQDINPQHHENSNTILERNIKTVDEFNSLIKDELFNKIIHKTKNIVKSQLTNSINWIELARLYTINNQTKQAEKCIQIALNLAPNNRFILRSSVRFYIHINEEEKALFYLRKSQATINDPWLTSAHIATSKLIGRYSPFIKHGQQIISSQKFSEFDLTELYSSLGTLELESGSFKKSKPLLDLSVKQPNDNSLAQLEWLSKKDNRVLFNSDLFSNVKNPFEAFAYENYQKGLIQESFYHCLNWFLDTPYNKRPLVFGSYLACLINDYDACIILCSVGLKQSNFELSFINNIVYALCIKGNLEQVPKYLELLSKTQNYEYTDIEKITIQATMGLYYLRKKEIEAGKEMYKRAIENSIKIQNKYFEQLAILNFTRELFLLNDPEYPSYKIQFDNVVSNEEDIKIIKKQVTEVINQKNK